MLSEVSQQDEHQQVSLTGRIQGREERALQGESWTDYNLWRQRQTTGSAGGGGCQGKAGSPSPSGGIR